MQMKKIGLKVTEAKAKDVGRIIARIDPEIMKQIGVETGDIIEIQGKRKTVAKIHPAYSEDRGKNIIQIDGIMRANAQIGLGENAVIKKASCKEAGIIILTPLTPISKQNTKEFLQYLEGSPLMAGDQIRINFFGGGSKEFEVTKTEPDEPDGAVIVTSSTELRFQGEKVVRDRTRVTYEDIGGLRKQIGKIREMIELPLKFSQVFERLGIEAPKGVLIYGPPGCGKTLIAKAVSNESGCAFFHISGPEIMGKFYGESEARLRSIFEDAERSAPAIIFIDEIDAIAPKREDMGGEKQVEKRVVAQLLALMDGLKSRGQLIVIGATNIPDVLDPALRRPGRFDREIVIPVPDKEGRREIFEIHTQGMPLAKDVSLEKLASETHGFTGADIEALCREAAMGALRKVMPMIDFERNIIPYEKLQTLEVTWDDFQNAEKEIEPSAIREFYIETPDVGWDDIGGLDKIKKTLRETVEWPLKYPKLIKHMATPPPKGILLYGPPGTGKTLVAKAVAKESGVNFISVKGPSLISKYVGESEKAVREVFKKARQTAPTIIFFDEIDAIAPKRLGSGMDSSHVSERTLSQLLNEMDGIEELKGVLVLAATNRIDMIDPALLRSGRFDLRLELPMPDEKYRVEIFKIHTRKKPLAKDVDLQKLANLTDGYSGADIEAICRKAALLAIREFVEKTDDPEKKAEQSKIKFVHFEKALEEADDTDAEIAI